MNPIPHDFAESHAAKTGPRRFSGEPMTGFGAPDFGAVLEDIREADADEAAIERRREIMAEEHALDLAEQRAERIARGE